MRLTDRQGAPWRPGADVWPQLLEVDRGEDARRAVAEIPGDVLRAMHRSGYLEHGLEPPPARMVELRRRLEQRVRAALEAAPKTRLVPISEAAVLDGVSVRTYRDQVTRGERPTVWVRGRRGMRELAVEVGESAPVRMQLPTFHPDPRVLAVMARTGARPGDQVGGTCGAATAGSGGERNGSRTGAGSAASADRRDGYPPTCHASRLLRGRTGCTRAGDLSLRPVVCPGQGLRSPAASKFLSDRRQWSGARSKRPA